MMCFRVIARRRSSEVFNAFYLHLVRFFPRFFFFRDDDTFTVFCLPYDLHLRLVRMTCVERVMLGSSAVSDLSKIISWIVLVRFKHNIELIRVESSIRSIMAVHPKTIQVKAKTLSKPLLLQIQTA